MPFPDNPTGGLYLIQPAIRSPNFVDGVMGWTINQDGSAQFVNVVIIGSDLKVLGTGGSEVEIHAVAGIARIDITPATGENPGSIVGSTANGGNQLVVHSPQNTTPPNGIATMILQGANGTFAYSAASITADEVQLVGLAGTSGVGSAGLDLGNLTGATAGVNLFAASSSIGMDGGGASLANEIALTTGSVALNGNRHWLLAEADNFDCSANTSLGGAFAAIPGMSTSYLNVLAGAKWVATVTIYGQLNATAGNILKTQLVVAGVAQTHTLDYGPAPSMTIPVCRAWAGTFAAGGTLTFAVNSMISGAGGAGNSVLSNCSTLQVSIYE